MKTRIYLLLFLFLSIGLTEVSAQNGAPYHSYPTKVNGWDGVLFVTCDGVNVDVIEYQFDGMDILHLCKGEPEWLKITAHWKFTSAVTGEEFRVTESCKYDVTLDSEGNFKTIKGTDRAILIGDAGSRYKLIFFLDWTTSSYTIEFLDFRCF